MVKKLFLLTIILLWIGQLPMAFAAPAPQAPPLPIAYGETASGTISEIQTTVTYVFDAVAGDRVRITMTATSGDLDSYLSLTTFNRTLLATDDNSAGQNNAALVFVVTDTAPYLINATRSPEAAGNTVGDFILTLENLNALPPQPSPSPTVESSVFVPAATPAPPVATPSLDPTLVANQRLRSFEIGTTARGQLGSDTAFNLHWFVGNANQQLIIIPDRSTSLQPMLVVYTSDFTELTRNRPSENMTVTLPSEGIFFISAALLDLSNAGDYAFTVIDANAANTPSTEQNITYGRTLGGIISNSNPTVRFQFRALAGDTITITMDAINGDLDPYILLVDSSGLTLAENDNSLDTVNSRLSFTLTNNGTYFIIATRRGGEQGITAGNFLLSLSSDAPPREVPTVTAVRPSEYAGLPSIQYGQTLTGEITDEAFRNFYIFQGTAGENVRITMTRAEGSQLDPFLILLDKDRIPLTENDDLADGVQDSQITFQLPESGFYAIVTTRYEQETGQTSGAFDLSLESLGTLAIAPGESVLDNLPATRLTTGDIPTGNFSNTNFAGFYTFSAAADTLIDFTIALDSSDIATVILTDSQLNPIAVSNTGTLLAVEAPTSDDYIVIVAPKNGPGFAVTTGYTVAVNISTREIVVTTPEANATEAPNDFQVDPLTDLPITIAYGTSERGSISANQNQRRYVFQGRAGDIVEISMTSVGAQLLDTYITLLDPTGEVVGENDDINPGINRNSFLIATLPDDGQYTIIATRYEGDTAEPELTEGDYELVLNFRDPALAGVNQEPNRLAYGATVSGVINDDTYLNFYFFEGTQGDTIEITIDRIDGNLDSILYLYTYTSAGEPLLLAANDDSPFGNTFDPYISYTLPRTALYLIAITRYAQNADELTSGSYNITLGLVE